MYYPRVVEVMPPPRSVADEVVDAYFGVLKPHDPTPRLQASELTMGQLRLLMHLRHEGSVTMGGIARASDCSLQSATALIERVERQGLVVRQRNEDDRRVVECHLTDRGRTLLDEMAGHRAAALRAALATLAPDELSQLRRLLFVMIERRDGGRELPADRTHPVRGAHA